MKSKLTGIIVIAALIVAVIFFVSPQTPIFTPKTNTGQTAQGCFLDANGKTFGCTDALKAPVGQDITNVNGQQVYGIAISKATVALNYTGTVNSWSLTGTEVVALDKGQSQSYAIAMSGQGPPAKSFGLSLGKTTWTSSELQAAWGVNYGAKKSNVSLTGISVTMKFSNGVTLTKPASYTYLLTWAMNYNAPESVSVSPPVVTIDGGTASGGTQDTWTTTVTSASNGLTGNVNSDGIIGVCEPYAVQSGYTLCWVYIPSGYALPACSSGFCGQVTVVNPSVSVGAFGLGFSSGAWTQATIPIGTQSGDLVLLQIFQSGQQIFNQAINISPVTTTAASGAAQVPPSPYTTQYLGWQTAQTSVTTTSTTSSCPFISPSKCLEFSVVSVTF